MSRSLRLLAVLAIACATPAFAEPDNEKCKDHTLFNRMPHFHLYDCKNIDFDVRGFPTGEPNPENSSPAATDVEGKVTVLTYYVGEGASVPSALQLQRNFENATKKAGGTVVGKYAGKCQVTLPAEHMPDMYSCAIGALTMKFQKGDKEVWALVNGGDDPVNNYVLTVVEKGDMQQDIATNDWASEIEKNGFVAIAVEFETAKADIKPESAGTIDQMVALLKGNAGLKVEIGGHTDNVGDAAANLKLSDARAKSVMAALVKGGIDAGRLTAKGYGQTAPVADNRTEEGRAKNRRVELTKK